MAIANPALVFRATGFLRTYLLDSSQPVMIPQRPFAKKTAYSYFNLSSELEKGRQESHIFVREM